MRVKSKKITFKPLSKLAEGVVPRPMPAGKYVPDWWKKIPAFKNGGSPDLNSGSEFTLEPSVKMCVPFADTFRFGYIQVTWADIYIKPHEFNEDDFEFYTADGPQMFDVRDNLQIPHAKSNSTYYPIELEWKTQWVPKLPRGYSALLIHPLNREDLPFTTLSGVVDADKYHHDADGNHPFYLKKGFSGIIPAGTPMYQIVPFKREDWESETEAYSEQVVYDGLKAHNKFWGSYKDRFWTKKNFK